MTTKIDQIKADIARLEADLKREEGKADARQKVTDLAKKLGYDLHELVEPAAAPSKGSKGTKRPPLPVKYRDGENTWSGKGPRPRWYAEKIAAGEDMTKYLVG